MNQAKFHQGTFTSQGTEITYTAYVDFTALRAMARRATRNKNHTCKDGALEVIVTNIQREDPQAPRNTE
jgi:hypothetical protein